MGARKFDRKLVIAEADLDQHWAKIVDWCDATAPCEIARLFDKLCGARNAVEIRGALCGMNWIALGAVKDLAIIGLYEGMMRLRKRKLDGGG
jgi:hypothetical protein